jgi:hypothetical protein
MDIRITALDADILRALSVFTYCSIPQLARIVGVKNENSVKNALQRLRRFARPLIKTHDYAFIAGYGRLHSISTLTVSGVNVLAEIDRIDASSIYFPALGVQYSRDYLHRRAFIDCHIAITQWANTCGAELRFFDRYFLAEGGNHAGGTDTLIRREYQTKIVLPKAEIIIPDGIFAFEQAGKTRLCALEIHQGRETKKIMNELEGHIRAIETAAIRTKYGLDDANFVLSVLQYPETMEVVMKRFRALPDYAALRLAFHFATLADVTNDVRQAWRVADGERVSLFR